MTLPGSERPLTQNVIREDLDEHRRERQSYCA